MLTRPHHYCLDDAGVLTAKAEPNEDSSDDIDQVAVKLGSSSSAEIASTDGVFNEIPLDPADMDTDVNPGRRS